MHDRLIHGVYSNSSALEAIAKALGEIKRADHLTYADLGAVLGKSEDQAAKYCDGTATMDFITFGRGRKEWGSRFTGYFDRLCDGSKPGRGSDHIALTAVVQAAACLAKALENGEIETHEVRDHRAELEAAHDAIGAQLAKLRPAVAS